MDDFDRISERALALRLTIPELREQAGVSRYSMWRARENRSGHDAKAKVLRALETALSLAEKERGQ